MKQRVPSGDNRDSEDRDTSTPQRVKDLKELPLDAGDTDEEDEVTDDTPSDSEFSDSQDKVIF